MIALLTKIPMITAVLGFFKRKPRLIAEYGLIAAVVIIGGLTVSQWYGKTKTETRLAETEAALSTLGGRLALVEAVNDAHERTIDNLRELRERDAQALEGLLNDYRDLSLRDAEVRSQLDALQQTNEIVRDYLSQPIPADLVRMLYDTSPTRARNPDRNED